MAGSPQRECNSDESLRFLLNFFTRLAMALNGLVIEKSSEWIRSICKKRRIQWEDSPLPNAVRISRPIKPPTAQRGAVSQQMTALVVSQDAMKEGSAGGFARMG
jgi:hypothetical protein